MRKLYGPEISGNDTEGGGFSETTQTPAGGLFYSNPQPQQAEDLRSRELREVGPDVWTDLYRKNMFGGGALPLPGMQLGNQNQAATEQARVLQALQAQAAGSRDTLGQQQLQRGYNQAAAQQRSLGSSIRGTGGGAGLRAGVMGAADTQRGLAGQSEMLKLQEQQAAQAMLAQLLAQQHAQDVGLAGALASGGLANQQLNQDMERFYGSGAVGADIYNYQRAFDLARAQAGYDLEARDAEARRNAQLAQASATAAGALAQMGNRNASSGYRQIDGSNSIVPINDK